MLAVVGLAFVSPTQGHTPTPTDIGAPLGGSVRNFRHSGSATPPASWMQAPIGAAAGDANASNASGAPDISVGSTGAGTIYYRATDDPDNPCDFNTIAMRIEARRRW